MVSEYALMADISLAEMAACLSYYCVFTFAIIMLKAAMDFMLAGLRLVRIELHFLAEMLEANKHLQDLWGCLRSLLWMGILCQMVALLVGIGCLGALLLSFMYMVLALSIITIVSEG